MYVVVVHFLRGRYCVSQDYKVHPLLYFYIYGQNPPNMCSSRCSDLGLRCVHRCMCLFYCFLFLCPLTINIVNHLSINPQTICLLVYSDATPWFFALSSIWCIGIHQLVPMWLFCLQSNFLSCRILYLSNFYIKMNMESILKNGQSFRSFGTF